MKYILTVLFLLLTNYGFCCTCGPTRSVFDEYDKATYVVIGTVVEHQTTIKTDSSEYKRLIEKGINEVQASRFTSVGYSHYKIVLSEPSYKGFLKSDTLIIQTALSSGACGYSFQIGKEYVVYGYDSKLEKELPIPFTEFESIWTNGCTRTKLSSVKERKTLIKIIKKKATNSK